MGYNHLNVIQEKILDSTLFFYHGYHPVLGEYKLGISQSGDFIFVGRKINDYFDNHGVQFLKMSEVMRLLSLA